MAVSDAGCGGSEKQGFSWQTQTLVVVGRRWYSLQSQTQVVGLSLWISWQSQMLFVGGEAQVLMAVPITGCGGRRDFSWQLQMLVVMGRQWKS